jgi:hypothetical protein
LPFADISQFPTMLDEVLESRASMLLRMRLQCRVVRTEDGEAVSSVENESDSESQNNLTVFLTSTLTTYILLQLCTR